MHYQFFNRSVNDEVISQVWWDSWGNSDVVRQKNNENVMAEHMSNLEIWWAMETK